MADSIKKTTATATSTEPKALDYDYYAEARKMVSNGADASLTCSQDTPTRFDIVEVKRAVRLKSEFIDGKPTGKLIPTPCVEVVFADGSTLKTYPTSPKKDGAFNPNGRPCVAPVLLEDAKVHWLALTKR